MLHPMRERSPMEEFGRPDPKIDLRKLSGDKVLDLLRRTLPEDPYYALSIAGYLYAPAAEASATIGGEDTISPHVLQQAGRLAVRAVKATAWDGELKTSMIEFWQSRYEQSTRPEQDDPAA